MSQLQLTRAYFAAMLTALLGRMTDDERGAATAEVIVLIGAAVIGAAAVGVIIWNKMKAGANSIPTPSP